MQNKKINHHHRNDPNLYKKQKHDHDRLVDQKIQVNFGRHARDPEATGIQKRRGAISKHETNVYMCVCPTPDLADLVCGEGAKE